MTPANRTGTIIALATFLLAAGGAVVADRLAVGADVAATIVKTQVNTWAIVTLKEDISDLRDTVNTLQSEQREFYRWMYQRAGEEKKALALTTAEALKEAKDDQ